MKHLQDSPDTLGSHLPERGEEGVCARWKRRPGFSCLPFLPVGALVKKNEARKGPRFLGEAFLPLADARAGAVTVTVSASGVIADSITVFVHEFLDLLLDLFLHLVSAAVATVSTAVTPTVTAAVATAVSSTSKNHTSNE